MGKSAILWEGPSRIDGAPLVVIGTWGSRNTKTGDMMQTWIVRSDMHPTGALHAGQDYSICGNCPMRGDGTGKARECYVNLMPVGATWKKYKRGGHPFWTVADLPSMPIRIGSYGDPVAVPLHVWETLIGYVGERVPWTGYTHQWRNEIAQDYKSILMASCDTAQDRIDAIRAGWRVFEVKRPSDAVPKGSIVCPATTHGVQCAACRLCGGTSVGGKNIVIDVHGPKARVKAHQERIAYD